MPSPIEIVAGGPAATSVTLTVPPTVTVKLLMEEPPGWTVPLNVSVVTVPVGAVTVTGSLLPPQAEANAPEAARATATANRAGSDRSPLMSGLACVAKFITDAAHGVEISRPRVLPGLDATAQTADERVDAPHRHEPVAAPDFRQQPFAIEDDSRVRGEDIQQLEL